MQSVNLAKAVVEQVSLEKGIGNVKAQVVLALDISGSMSGLYHNGYVQQVLERIIPIAMQFDDNQSFELYLFSNGVKKADDVTLNNIIGFVQDRILRKYFFGGTEYAPCIDKIVKDYVPTSGLFVKKAKNVEAPVYVIFITDGNNEDHFEAEKALINASEHGIFFQFVGMGSARFSFLEKLDDLPGRFIDNANFFAVNDLTKISDQELYSKLLNEFPSWLQLATGKGII
jgi:hypothetical protein